MKSYADSVSGDAFSYTYDANGKRLTKTVNGATTNYYYAGGRMVGLMTGTNAMRFRLSASGEYIGFTYGGNAYYYVKNLQGDVVDIVNIYGYSVVQYTYDAWGRILSVTGSRANDLGVINPFRYRGYMYDEETGLYFLTTRYYNPEWGRFLTFDTTLGANGDIHSYNLYAYCSWNPISFKDATGQVLEAVVPLVAVAAVDIVLVFGAVAIGAMLIWASYALTSQTMTGTISLPQWNFWDTFRELFDRIIKALTKVDAEVLVDVATLPKTSEEDDFYIYRWPNPRTGEVQFYPRVSDVETNSGLSFSITEYRPGSAVISFQELNNDPLFVVIITSATHVAVYPNMATLGEWHGQGELSKWTIRLRELCFYI